MKKTLQEIAEYVGGRVEGDASAAAADHHDPGIAPLQFLREGVRDPHIVRGGHRRQVDLVVELPVLHAVRFRMSVLRADAAPCRGRCSIAVLDEIERVLQRRGIRHDLRARSDVEHHDRFRADPAAERHELVDAERERIDLVPLHAALVDALVLRSDRILPPIPRRERAARPADARRFQAGQRLE